MSNLRWSEDRLAQHYKEKGITPGEAKPGKAGEPRKAGRQAEEVKAHRGDVLSELEAPENLLKIRGLTWSDLNPIEKKIAAYSPALGNKEKTQTEFSFEVNFLWPKLESGELEFYRFERLRFVLGQGRIYLPDYYGRWAENKSFQVWEIKGAWIHDKGFTKFDAASAAFPEYSWELWQKKKQVWTRRRKS